MTDINKHGWWYNIDEEDHKFDVALSRSLTQFFQNEKANSVVDFGCGRGMYAQMFHQQGLNVNCYDGSPDTHDVTNGLCNILDLAADFNLNRKYDWVLSLEVGEHIPEEYCHIFVRNLIKHCEKGIILSWAVRGQDGKGHVNCMDNAEIKELFEKLGFINDIEIENRFRQVAEYYWFKNTIMVFRKAEILQDIGTRWEYMFPEESEIASDFDPIFYGSMYPDTEAFFQPYAKDNNISDKRRLWLQYIQHGKELGCKPNGKILYVKPTHGLANRLYQIDSAVAFAHQNNFDAVRVCWEESEGFSNETFDELFYKDAIPEGYFGFIDHKAYELAKSQYMSLENYFTKSEDIEYIWLENRNIIYDQICNSSFCFNSPYSIDWIFSMSLDTRKSFIRNHIFPNELLNEQIISYNIDQSYVGLHIRLGDAVNSSYEFNKHYQTVEYDAIIKKHDKIFLSTDSKGIQDALLEKYPEKITVSKKDFVNTSITVNDPKPLQKEAVIDFFLLSQTSKIYGTNWSTFSQCAADKGDITKISLSAENMFLYNTEDTDYEYSVVTAVMNRDNILKSSIHSWLLKDEIKEIVIVDWSSKSFDKEYFTKLDKRIKVVTVEGEEHFHLSKAYNVAIKETTYPYVMKLDVDYFLNPYNNLKDWIYYDFDRCFLTGHWQLKSQDNEMGFIQYLNGFVICKKEFLENVNMYDGNKHGYGWDDDQLYSKLEKLGLERVLVESIPNESPIFHIPHHDNRRGENYKNKNIRDSLLRNQGEDDNFS